MFGAGRTWSKNVARVTGGIVQGPSQSPTFPLSVHSSGRYLVDAKSQPFRIHGEASWDAHLNLSRTDWLTYLDDRKAKGFTALFTYVSNPIPYYHGSSTPWMASLGGSGAGASALPFTLNASGGTWNGDPTFANFDAAFSSPNDSFHAQVAQFVDDCAARGILVILNPCYAGFNQGAQDGWLQTVGNSANTTTVCNGYGAYLATGHGTFTGFASRKNIIWSWGGDTMPTLGGTAALRLLQVFAGLQSNGCNQPVASHIQRNYLPSDDTDVSTLLTTYGLYASNPTYAMARQLYGAATTKPIVPVEFYYWGDADQSQTVGQTRATFRYVNWSCALSSQCGGCVPGFSPFWGFTTSADGSTAAIPGSDITCWAASSAYHINQYVSKGGNWYKCTAPGTSAASGGPTGNGTSIGDGSATWTYVASVSGTLGGMAYLLNEPGVLDQRMVASVMSALPWWRLVPESLGGTGTIIASGQGTASTFVDQSPPSGGNNDWIVAAWSTDGSTIVAYVPDAHTGSFSVNMSLMARSCAAYWIDPTSAQSYYIASYPNTGTQSFTVPGANAGGDHDWVLVLQAPG